MINLKIISLFIQKEYNQDIFSIHACAGDINLPHTPFPPPNKKIKYNKILTYILRSIFLEIPHLELQR
jgi:hypothetical protein